ncbi:MAG: AGE family epimerase/isomerase, partial [Planctomycetota bacterium]
MKFCRLLLVCLSAAAWVTPDVAAADERTADRCRELQKSLFDFYLASVDTKHGGYLEQLDAKGRFSGEEKFLTLQARQLWYFSAMANHGLNREKALGAAKSGYDFLVRHFHDDDHGGYFAKTDRSGKPIDSRKH